MANHFRMRMTDERTDRMRRLMEATDESTQTKAIDMAMKHYLADLEAKERHVDDMDPELVKALTTPYIPIERDVETRVGRLEE